MAKEKDRAAKKTKTGGKPMKKGTYQTLRILFFVFLFIIVVLIGGFIAVHAIFNFDTEDSGNDTGEIDIIDRDSDDVDENIQVDILEGLKNSDSLEAALKEWAENNTENSYMKSASVINFLLVGVDNSGQNTDVMMLMSLNQRTKKIYLTSLMRDSYTYIKNSNGGYASKLNAAYAGGGMRSLITTIEDNYKIRIDHYVSVNFDTFVQIVDILGGVKVPLQYYEAREMERVGRYAPGTSVTEYGDSILLTGRQALLYCRIRKCDTDGDVSRTRRQRQFISALINEAGNINASQATDMVKTLLKYVKTDCTTSELISLATKAVVNKWYNYEIVSQSYPLPENRMDYRGYAWIWVVDYPGDAVALQKEIYGTTNIQLPENRTTAIDIMR